MCECILKLAVVVDTNKSKVGFVDRLVVAAHSVVIAYENDLVVRISVLLAIKIKSVVFIIRIGSHIEGG